MNTKWLFLFLTAPVLVMAQAEGNFKQSRAVQQAPVNMDKEVEMQQNYRASNPAPVSANYSNASAYGQQAYYNPSGLTIAGENVAILTINALSNQKAKDYIAIFNVTQLGATAEEADRLMNERIAKFMAGASAINVGKDNIYTDMVSFVPRYEVVAAKKTFSKKTFTEVPKGFILQKNIHIRFTEPEVLDKLISEAAKSEIYEIVKVDYNVENPDKIYSELRAKAFDYLNQQIESYKKIGMRLDTAYRITAENTFATYPSNRYASYQAYSTFSVDAMKSAPVAEAEKTTTSFYNAIPADAYDIVINPTILEPSVQYSYSIKVKFTLKERMPYMKTEYKNTKEIMIITPTGEMKTITVETK